MRDSRHKRIGDRLHSQGFRDLRSKYLNASVCLLALRRSPES
ncbi:MAG: hypothetical protein WBA10_09500 [Elainellaceae cyanobacterium]